MPGVDQAAIAATCISSDALAAFLAIGIVGPTAAMAGSARTFRYQMSVKPLAIEKVAGHGLGQRDCHRARTRGGGVVEQVHYFAGRKNGDRPMGTRSHIVHKAMVFAPVLAQTTTFTCRLRVPRLAHHGAVPFAVQHRWSHARGRDPVPPPRGTNRVPPPCRGTEVDFAWQHLLVA